MNNLTSQEKKTLKSLDLILDNVDLLMDSELVKLIDAVQTELYKRRNETYYDKESTLSIRAKAELLEQRVILNIDFPWVPSLEHFTNPEIRKEISEKLGND